MIEDTSSQPNQNVNQVIDTSLDNLVDIKFTKRQLIFLFNLLAGRTESQLKFNLGDANVIIPMMDAILPLVVESDNTQMKIVKPVNKNKENNRRAKNIEKGN
jgi:hypothetical protein